MDRYTLSDPQRALWFMHELAPRSPAYNTVIAARLRAPLDAAALARAVVRMTSRHRLLRSTITREVGEPQLSERGDPSGVTPSIPVEVIDAPAGASEVEIEGLLAEQIARPFDLGREAPTRVHAIRRSDDAWIALVLHHIAADLEALATAMDELLALLAEEVGAAASRLPAPGRGYEALAAAQAERLDGPEGARLRAYWATHLDGAPTLELPLDRPRPRRRALTGSHHPFVLPAPVVAALRSAARDAGASLASALLAAFAVLLHRHAGQDEVVIGVSSAGRRGVDDFAGTVGTFVNTLPIRIDLTGDPGFAALLPRAQAALRAGVAHEGYPFLRIAQGSTSARDLSRPPVYQAAFALQRVPRLQETGLAPLLAPAAAGRTLERHGLPLAATAISQQNGQVDLALWALELDGELLCELKYDDALFEPATIAAMADRLAVLCAGLAAAPECPVGQVPMIDADARAELLAAAGAPLPEFPARTLHGWFAAIAARAPERIAVTCEGASIAYGALDRAADRLAQRLRAAGVARGDRIGLCLERSPALLVGILGILKAGAAYVPMDPLYPAERLAFIVDDAACPLVVTEPKCAPLVPAATRRILLGAPDAADVVDPGAIDPGAIDSDDPGAPSDVPSDPGDLAYMIYTSGSTGAPKGTLVTHANVVSLMVACDQRVRLGEGDVWTLFHSFGFDVSVWEIWGALLYGGRLVVVPHWTARTPEATLALLRAEGVTVFTQTPSSFLALDAADALAPAPFPDLRAIILCGEATDPRALAGWFERHGDAQPRLLNMYGITETTVHSTYRELVAADVERGGSPIGVPLANTRIVLLDRFGEPVPPGVPGEIHVAGAGVTRGYHRRPELTAARFLERPWATGPLYRSGDLARLRDGELDFLRRADAQVKIRGYRIELGEVEAALRRQDGVAEARVIVRGEGGDRRLCAYVVPAPGRALDPRRLREALAAGLPPQMVPSGIAALPALPRTAHGKLDVRALPEPTALADERPAAAPEGAVEVALAGLWRDALGLAAAPGRDDDFFALGGHSLKAAALRTAIERALGVRISVASIFEAPTIAGVARAVAAAREELSSGTGTLIPTPTPAPAPALRPDPEARFDPFPLTDAQEAYWVGRSGAYALGGVGSQVYWEFEAAGDLDLGRLEAAWRRLVDRHGMLRAIVEGGRQRVLAEVPPFRLEVLDLGRLAAADADARLLERREALSQRVFQPDVWPLWRVQATLLPGGALRLHLAFDALVVDAASLFLLLGEWARVYDDPAAALPELPITFRDYVIAARAYEAGPRSAAAAAYWEARLYALPPPPSLPLASTPAPGEVPRFARQSGRLDPERWRGLKARAAREGLTPSGILCAAYAEVLGAWSGSERFLVNVTTFSRLPVHPAVDRLVGDFTSILLLEVDRAGATLRDRARALQAQLAADLEHLEVSGVRVLREARRRGIEVAAPVVFTSALVHQDDPRGGFPELLGRRVEGLAQTPQVWLDHVVFEEDGALIYVWDAVEALFPPGVLKDMFAAYEALVAALADDEARWRRPLRSLTPAAHLAERAALQGDAGPPPAGLLHHGFEARAAADPAATAVIDGDRALSYGALASWSRRIARALGAAGVAPGSKVAITLEKGAAQVAAALAASMAGVAYVPIDPALPPARLRRLYPHAEVAAAITREGLADGLPPGPARICVDDPALATVDDAPLPDRAAPGDLAYVIYTSGSTGEPKGVMIDHRGALNTIDDVHRRFGVGPSDRVLALSSLSFDLSVYDLFGLLSAGGALVIPPPGSERDPAAWSALCRAHRVTLWNSVPALMDMFVRHADGRPELAAPDLRLCLLSGDWIPVRLPDAIRALHPGAAVVSLGGATEASIWSIAYPIGAVDPAWTSIPYGRPLTRQGLHVLDARLEPCPIWVPGHLYITGVGVALGYLGDPERTAASFLALPSGERAYRTGDLGRYLPGGDLEFLGREDLQVKIQGYRVELGEIEAALAEHPEVEAAVAVARGEARGARRLVTYAVARAGGAGPADAALQKLSEGTGRPDLAARPRVALPGPPPAPADYRGSQSVRAWLATPTPLAALGRLLAAIAPATLPESPLPKRRYPSAGGLYPVHAYVLARAVEGLEAGAYWLDPRANSLVWVGPGRLDPADHGEYNRAFVGDAAFTVVLVADLAAIEPRYGDRARDFCLLEAGAIAQLLRSEAPAAGVGLCAIGSIAEAPLRAALALGDAHAVVHALVGGAVAPGRFDRVELAPAAAPLGERLRDHLAARLPAYMVPAQVVLLPALPLGATGKVDRARLPAPEDNLSPRPEDSPADPRERELAALVAELLGVAEVGASTPFFAAGATSLHLVRLHAALRERFAVDLPIVEVFRHPTIRALAARLDRAGAQGGAPEPGADADADAAASERGLDRARARLAARRGGRR